MSQRRFCMCTGDVFWDYIVNLQYTHENYRSKRSQSSSAQLRKRSRERRKKKADALTLNDLIYISAYILLFLLLCLYRYILPMHFFSQCCSCNVLSMLIKERKLAQIHFSAHRLISLANINKMLGLNYLLIFIQQFTRYLVNYKDRVKLKPVIYLFCSLQFTSLRTTVRS